MVNSAIERRPDPAQHRNGALMVRYTETRLAPLDSLSRPLLELLAESIRKIAIYRSWFESIFQRDV